MGESLDEVDKPPPLAGHLSELTWHTFAGYIAKEYGIPDDAEFSFFIERLVGIVIHDQRLPPPPFESPVAQRKAVHASAKNISSKARSVEQGLQDLQAALSDFNAAMGGSDWTASMLEEVFDMPYVESNALDAPEMFDPVRGFFISHAEALNEIRGDLQALSALPVKPRLRTNKVRNHVLRQALMVCRSFWVEQLGRTWSRSYLPTLGQDGSGKRGELVERNCEGFVNDMLTAVGIDFDHKKLNGAWSAFEKATPKRVVRAARF